MKKQLDKMQATITHVERKQEKRVVRNAREVPLA
jgi:hypothetical protein